MMWDGIFHEEKQINLLIIFSHSNEWTRHWTSKFPLKCQTALISHTQYSHTEDTTDTVTLHDLDLTSRFRSALSRCRLLLSLAFCKAMYSELCSSSRAFFRWAAAWAMTLPLTDLNRLLCCGVKLHFTRKARREQHMYNLSLMSKGKSSR